MFKICRMIIGLYLICSFHTPLQAQQTHEKMTRTVNYLLYLPDGYTQDSTKKWPLMLFLHGGGESGEDLEKVKKHGPPRLIEEGKKFPFIVVSPQAGQFGWITEDLYALLQDIKQDYRVDPERIYLTGLSMGGFGTWALAIKHPQEFAAIVPICGGGDTTDIWKLRNMPVWCFHGAKDSTVPIALDRKMVNALKPFNPSVRFTVYPDAGHDCWTTTYNNDSLYQWLLAQKKFVFTPIPASAAELNAFAGQYLGPDKDTVIVRVSGDTLLAQTHNNRSFELKPAGDRKFFIDLHIPVEIRFTKNFTGKITGFTLFEDSKVAYKKISR